MKMRNKERGPESDYTSPLLAIKCAGDFNKDGRPLTEYNYV